ncbi:MAG: 4-hydroxy-tetrahydrodipicolinate synthase [Coriobacteriaceae bacterium]|nr:4-hydroxy-tetrahydrodipicolinate synthase [Coriobacteriaceae bacterium]MDD7112751.1 4-hydroxy-tetrahydrodipicolinate synthase [Coriobacteriaceae bacterium]MDY3752877.1 4-hydroxy-tetrahydrodipicolinate synthase [Collinsella sp.]MDY5809068.1 4-hydroxy-tetrahydrodipicolinate synthase [Coriobacteriales bacterium]
MKKTIFTGAATAIVTPFKNGVVDYDMYGTLIDWQIEQGIDAIVTVGTTGEGPTLTHEEHREVIRYCVEKVAHRVPVIAGTGSNCTEEAIGLTKFAAQVGADAALLVTPYYNKATQAGLVASFTAVADAADLPCVLYNVPGRTGCNIQPATVAKLAEHPMICAVKEASGNISQVAQIAALAGDKIDIYSGNDDQVVPIMALGGKGVISVLSNVAPAATVEMCRRMLAGDVAGARELQLKYLPLIDALFCEVNPIPVKAAMAAMGYGENSLRLPLTCMEPAHEERLLGCMRDLGIIA